MVSPSQPHNAWGPAVETPAGWGPSLSSLEPAATRGQTTGENRSDAVEAPPTTIVWLDESTGVGVSVHHAGASDEQVLAALESATRRLRLVVERSVRRAA